jgi:hypothetical protein
LASAIPKPSEKRTKPRGIGEGQEPGILEERKLVLDRAKKQFSES